MQNQQQWHTMGRAEQTSYHLPNQHCATNSSKDNLTHQVAPGCRIDTRTLTFKRRIKSHLPFADIIRSSSYSTGFQDKG